MEMVLDWRSVGSLLATIMVFRTAMRDFLPPEAEIFLRRLLTRLAAAFRPHVGTILIDEADGASGGANDLYDASQLYLGARCLATAPTVRLHKPRQAPRPVASLPDAHTTHDVFRGVLVKWTARPDRARRLRTGGGGGCEDAADDPDTVSGLMADAEGLLAAGVLITPADIAEVFMGCDGAGATAALRKLADELRRRRDAPAVPVTEEAAMTTE
ncbi:hypothetical protein OsI_24324 [Oryza sativa Indica Group]|uniref:AAA-type ATPase N-terminal domain-containing protein n=1 Tax=Oryza sativa subsp. indica TaxID=39946 RepID=A2YGL7_ORYSI|nr:hypothetical protein OsI_24324 [Oryza sativa Indica Group]